MIDIPYSVKTVDIWISVFIKFYEQPFLSMLPVADCMLEQQSWVVARDYVEHSTTNNYYLALYRRRLLTPAVLPCSRKYSSRTDDIVTRELVRNANSLAPFRTYLSRICSLTGTPDDYVHNKAWETLLRHSSCCLKIVCQYFNRRKNGNMTRVGKCMSYGRSMQSKTNLVHCIVAKCNLVG